MRKACAEETVWKSADAGDLKTLMLLAARGHDLSVAQPGTGLTPLWLAANSGAAPIIDFLFRMKKGKTSPARDGSTPLFAAAQNGHYECVAALLLRDSHRATLNVHRETDCATPLYIAAQRGFSNVVRLLIQAGASCNMPRKGGYTPLWTAAQRGHLQIVKLLIAGGADLSFRSTSGIQPAEAARRAGHSTVARVLVDMMTSIEVQELHLKRTARTQRGKKEDHQRSGPKGTEACAHSAAEAAHTSDTAVAAATTRSMMTMMKNGALFFDPCLGPRQRSVYGLEQGSVASLSVWPQRYNRSDCHWDMYIKQKKHFTHDICKCVRTLEKQKKQDAKKPGTSKLRDEEEGHQKCHWWRLRPGVEIECFQVSRQLINQVIALHCFAKSCSRGKLQITQVVFTEGRGSHAKRAHTLEVRFINARDKREAHINWDIVSNARLVRQDEVVLLLAIPLRFPVDGRVKVHCMQGKGRLPAAVLGNAHDGDGTAGKEREGEDGYGFPGEPLNFTWVSPSVWPSTCTLGNFIKELLWRVGENGGLAQKGGDIPTCIALSHANATLASNEDSLKQGHERRVACLNAPMTAQERSAVSYVALGVFAQIAGAIALLLLKRNGV
jgi:hypothetical protein